MAILKNEKGKYILRCDICNKIGEFKNTKNWESRQVDNGYIDLCPKCKNKSKEGK